jgi:predicted Zn-dependent protease
VADQPKKPSRKRRVNVKFIVIIVACIWVVLIGGFALNRFMRHYTQQKQIVGGHQALEEKRYKEAVDDLSAAFRKEPTNAVVGVDLGDAFYQSSATEADALPKAHAAWEAVLRSKPDSLAALRRLMSFHADMAEVKPAEATFHDLGAVTEKILAIVPEDLEAQTYQRIADVGPWATGVAKATNTTNPAVHDQQIDSLAEAIARGPADGAGLYYLALASITRAQDLWRNHQGEAAEKSLKQAEQQLEMALQSMTLQAGVLYRGAQGLTLLAVAEGRSLDQATTQPAAGPAKSAQTLEGLANAPAVKHCLDLAKQAAQHAAQMTKALDPYFVPIRLLQSSIELDRDQRAAAEAICRQALSERPRSLALQLALADLLRPTDPQQAVRIVEQPEDPADSGPGPRSLSRPNLVVRSSILKASVYLDSAADLDDAKLRAAQLDKASSAIDTLATQLVENPIGLKLTARLRMLQGRYLDAIVASDRAMALMASQHITDAELPYYKASSLLSLHEPGSAMDILRPDLTTGSAPASYKLLAAHILVDEGKFADAAAVLDDAARELGAPPELVTMRLSLLEAQNAAGPTDALKKQIHDNYILLPEVDEKQKLRKARQAKVTGETADRVRLLQAVASAHADSITITADLAQALLANHQADQARAVLAKALQAHPDSSLLLYVQKRVGGASPDELAAYREQLNQATATPLAKALRSIRLAMAHRDWAQARQQLDAASALKADEPAVTELWFQYHLAVERWPDAAVDADKLAKADFDQMDGLSYRFALAMARKELPAATNFAQQMVFRAPQFSGAHLALGEALQASGHHELAIKPFQEAWLLRQDNLPAIKGAAISSRAAGQGQDAQRWIAIGLKLAPKDPELREMDFAAQLQTGEPQQLIAAREEAMKNEPGQIDDVIDLARVYLRIQAVEAMKSPDAAKSALQQAAQILDGAIQRWPDDQAGYIWAASTAALSGHSETGEKILRQLAARPAWAHSPRPWLLLADYQLTLNNLPGVEAAFREAMSRGTNNAGLAQRLGYVLSQQGKWDAALDVLQPYANDPQIQWQRVQTLLTAGKADKAEAEIKAAQEKDQTSGRLMTLLGLICASRNDMTHADYWLERAAAGNDSVKARRIRGELHLRQPNASLVDIVDDLTPSHDANLADADTAILLAEALIRKQDLDSAANVLEQSLKVAPQDKRLRLSMIDIESRRKSPRWERVMSLINDGRSFSPSDPDWDAMEARAWLGRGDATKAAALMRNAIATVANAAPKPGADVPAYPTDSRSRQWIREELTMLDAAGDNTAAIHEADGVISSFGPADSLTGWAHLARATALRRSSAALDQVSAEYDAALAAAQRASDVPAAMAMVRAIFAQSSDQAMRLLQNVGSAAPQAATGTVSDLRWDVLRAELLARSGDLPAALNAVNAAMSSLAKLPSQDQIAMLRLACEVYVRAGSQADKIRLGAVYQALLERVPDDVWTMNNLAVYLIEQAQPAQPAQALEMSRKAYQLLQRQGVVNPHVADTYGWALASAGQPRTAIDVLKTAVDQLHTAGTEYHLAEAYLRCGASSQAWSHLQAAIDLLRQSQSIGSPHDSALRCRIGDALRRAIVPSLLAS